MSGLVPSWVQKVARAEKHLVELKEAINAYIASHPYGVRTSVEGKKKRNVHRLVFHQVPANTQIPIIAADVLYNLRSALDHLTCALVPSAGRRSVYPVLWKGVWEPPVEGENKQRVKDRGKWITYTRGMKPEAVALLKEMQPPDDSGPDEAPHLFRIMNTLANADRHRQLPVLASGLRSGTIKWTGGDGTEHVDMDARSTNSQNIHENGTVIQVPDDAVDVHIIGSPAIAVSVADKNWDVELPDIFDNGVSILRNKVIPDLSPHIHVPGGKAKG